MLVYAKESQKNSNRIELPPLDKVHIQKTASNFTSNDENLTVSPLILGEDKKVYFHHSFHHIFGMSSECSKARKGSKGQDVDNIRQK
jgi:hypothetical protein